MSNSNPAAAVLTATRAADGDYRLTVRALARFCTEALRDAAGTCLVAGKFAAPLPTWREATRDEAIWFLCGWANHERIREWAIAYNAARVAAAAALPEALAELGAAL